MEWTVVTVLVALVGLFVTVSRPVVELNRSITRLTTMLENMAQRLDQHDDRLHRLEKEE